MEVDKNVWKLIRLDGNRKKCEWWITKIRFDKRYKNRKQ